MRTCPSYLFRCVHPRTRIPHTLLSSSLLATGHENGGAPFLHLWCRRASSAATSLPLDADEQQNAPNLPDWVPSRYRGRLIEEERRARWRGKNVVRKKTKNPKQASVSSASAAKEPPSGQRRYLAIAQHVEQWALGKRRSHRRSRESRDSPRAWRTALGAGLWDRKLIPLASCDDAGTDMVSLLMAAKQVPGTGASPDPVPMVAFIGRSNVGKSSLFNTLTGRGRAQVKDKPGTTQAIQWWLLGRRLCLADLPGIGFAYASEQQRIEWRQLIHSFLDQGSRMQLKRVFIVVDARQGLRHHDVSLAQACNERRVPFQVVMNKSDLLAPSELVEQAARCEAQLRCYRRAVFPVQLTSHDGRGVVPLARSLGSLLPRGTVKPFQRPTSSLNARHRVAVASDVTPLSMKRQSGTQEGKAVPASGGEQGKTRRRKQRKGRKTIVASDSVVIQSVRRPKNQEQ